MGRKHHKDVESKYLVACKSLDEAMQNSLHCLKAIIAPITYAANVPRSPFVFWLSYVSYDPKASRHRLLEPNLIPNSLLLFQEPVLSLLSLVTT